MYLLGSVRSLLPPDVLGLGLGLFGSMLFVGFALTTAATGWLLALGHGQGMSPPDNFGFTFAVLAAVIAVAALCCPLPRATAINKNDG